MDDLEVVKHLYSYLSEGNKLLFLLWLHETDKHKMEYASMPDTLRRIYDEKLIKGDDNGKNPQG